MILGTLLLAVVLFVAQGIYRNYGRPTFDALPPNIDEPREWVGKDHDRVWYTRWVKYVMGWFAFGPYSKFAWARWRETPVTLLGIRGSGAWRVENDDYGRLPWPEGPLLWPKLKTGENGWYLSRCQYWTRWHVAVQWPFQITFHFYLRAKDVPQYPQRPTGAEKMVFMYGPTHRDADKVYWMPGFFVGGSWK